VEKIKAKKYLDKPNCKKIPLPIIGLLFEMSRNQNELIDKITQLEGVFLRTTKMKGYTAKIAIIDDPIPQEKSCDNCFYGNYKYNENKGMCKECENDNYSMWASNEEKHLKINCLREKKWTDEEVTQWCCDFEYWLLADLLKTGLSTKDYTELNIGDYYKRFQEFKESKK